MLRVGRISWNEIIREFNHTAIIPSSVELPRSGRSGKRQGSSERIVGDSSIARIGAPMDGNTVARQSAIIAGKMKDELCSKIQAIVDRKIRKEMQVVYLLVEARKLMDRENYTDPVL